MVANLGHAGSCVILFFNFILKSKIKKCQNLINFSKNTCRFRRRFWIEYQGRKIIHKTSWATSLTCLLYDVILYQIQHIFFKFNQKHQIFMTINTQQMEIKPTTESKQLKIQNLPLICVPKSILHTSSYPRTVLSPAFGV